MTIIEIHNLFLQSSGVVIDTRKIIQNSFFVALKGDRFDANIFAKEALENGASFVIIDNKDYYINEKTILVEDSLVTLQELAKYHRTYLNLKIIALTGSNGKTTTKELIQVVLAKKFRTKATVGNLNNHIGVPLTLLSFDKNIEIGIVEMGANHQKEIEFLCQIAKPDYGYITNFGKAHLEGFGGVEGVIKGKSELYKYLELTHKKVFLNIDDVIQNDLSKEIESISFSIINEKCDVFFKKVSANPFVSVCFKNTIINSHLIGLYNATNINAAITMGVYFGVSDEDIKNAIESYVPENNRSQLLIKHSNEIILDAYNANPSSMMVALDNFLQLDKHNKVIIIGDMFELGVQSLYEHKLIVDYLIKIRNIDCFFIGKDFFSNKCDVENLSFYRDFDSFAAYLKQNVFVNKTILIKGSRGMALERTLEFL